MKNIFVKKIKTRETGEQNNFQPFSKKIATRHSISEINWPEYSYQPKVYFDILHTENHIWLKFYVNEKYLLARETKINGDVYKDSCVEFFISFDKINYYNFEFNCIGTTHLAYGPDRNNRTFVPDEIVKTIKTKSSLGNEPFNEKSGNFDWDITICIPIECFVFDNITVLKNKKAFANFYKCGDETSQPHYLTWNPIKTENPDYHQPAFFGNLMFE